MTTTRVAPPATLADATYTKSTRSEEGVPVGKHHDKDKEEDERKQQGNGQVPAGTWVSPKDPQGKHSPPKPDEQEDEE